MQLEDIFYVLREQDMIVVYDGNNGNSRTPATSKYRARDGHPPGNPATSAIKGGGQATEAKQPRKRGRPAFTSEATVDDRGAERAPVQGPGQERGRIPAARLQHPL